MQALTRATAIAGLLALAAGGTAHTVQHTLADQNTVGYVYVNDNTAGANTVAGFAEHQDGSLTALPGSPFNVGGVGPGKGLGSQDSIQATRDGRFLLVADAASNQISVLTIDPGTGNLTPIANSPFSSNGIQPVSIAVQGNLVYVANDGSAASSIPANYAGFTLTQRATRLIPAGQLIPIGTPVPAPTAANDLGDVLLNGNGTSLVGIEVGLTTPTVTPSLIDSFSVDVHGDLFNPHQTVASPVGPFGSTFRPGNPSQLFVSNAHGGTLAGAVSAYTVHGDASLTPIGASPFADYQTAPCWVAITPDGQYLFAVNTGSGSISSYAINWDGSLSLLGDLTLSGSAPVKALDLRVDSHGRNLFGIDSGLDAVSELHIHDGFILEAPTSPIALPVGASPSGIAVVGSYQD